MSANAINQLTESDMMSKRTAMISALSAIAMMAPSAYAKDTASAAKEAGKAPVSVSDTKKEVQSAFAAWRTALSGGKASAIVDLYAKDGVLLATLNNKPITDQKERTKYFEGLTAKPELKATVNEEIVRVLDEDDAIVSGVYTFSFKDGEKTVSIPARYSFVFDKIDGKWMIVEHHSSKMPMDK
jgi:uncharacterized protein (TIGR02246 family)